MFNSSPRLSVDAHAVKADKIHTTSHVHYLPSVSRAMLTTVSELRCRFLCDGFAYCVRRWPRLVEDSQQNILAAVRQAGQTDVTAIQQLHVVEV